jgi:hypothetical protein
VDWNTLGKRVSGFFGHGLTLLAAGAVLTYVLVPLVNEARLLQEARIKKALEILETGSEVDANLNSLQTTLAIFHKDHSYERLPPDQYAAARHRALERMEARYLEFDKRAWWWLRRVEADARLLKVEGFKDYSNKYMKSLIASTQKLDTFWTRLLRQNSNPQDPEIGRLVETTQEELTRLNLERTKWLYQMVKVFMP